MTRLLVANGVNSDLELFLFGNDHPEYANDLTTDVIVERAPTALAVCPGSDGHDTLAWALYRAGDPQAA